MSRFGDFLKKGAMASLFCMAVMMALPPAPALATPVASSAKQSKTNKIKNLFSAPDFAFPKTVEKNAREKFVTALAQGDGLNALRAAIQLDIASNLVSTDRYAESLARFDTLANKLDAPWSNLSLLLEARLYRDIYVSDLWNFNRRTLPLSPRPDNVMEWSTPMFSAAVSELVSRALENMGAIANIPLSDISGLLTDSDDAVKAGFTVLDFMTIEAERCLLPFISRGVSDVIPFGRSNDEAQGGSVSSDTPDALILSLIDIAIARHFAEADKFKESYFCNMKLGRLTGESRKSYIVECVDRFGDTPYCASFISAYVNENLGEEFINQSASEDSDKELMANNTLSRKKLTLLEDYIARFPEASGIGDLQQLAKSLKMQRVSLNFPNQLLPGRTNKISVNGSNLYDFYILVYSVPGKYSDRRPTYSDVKTRGKLLHCVPVKISATTPDLYKEWVEIPALEPGVYTFIPSTTATAAGIIEKSGRAQVSTTLVSSLTAVTTRGNATGDGELFIVSAFNQKPMAGVRVTLTPQVNGRNGSPIVKTTDKDGRVAYPNGDYVYSAEADGSFVTGRIYREYNFDQHLRPLYAKVMTDLSIYRPGDKVQFTGVAYERGDKTFSAAKSRTMRAYLCDANYQKVDSLDLITDSFGRLDGMFTLPEAGLLGNWSIRLDDETGSIADEYFNVADYKAPTFMVTVDSASESYKAGDELSFGGKATTYSGMPVSGGKVSYTVEYRPYWWWRGGGSDAQYGGETSIGADGSFTITLPTERLKGTAYARGYYTLRVSVTTAAGETREAPALAFGLGSALRIESSVPNLIDAGNMSGDFKVTVYDIAGHPVRKQLFYDLTASDGKRMLGGEFESPSFHLDLKNVPSGRYRLRFSLSPDFKDSDEYQVLSDSITIWRSDDKRPPVMTPLWLPETNVIVPSGENKAKIRVGSSYGDSYILAFVTDTKRKISTEWVRVSDGFAVVTVDAPVGNERIFVELIGERDLRCESGTVTLIPHEQNVRLDIKAESFRDRLDPGAKETWKFRFTLDGKDCASLPAMAVMSNKALNALAPFKWAFNPYGSLYWNQAVRFNFNQRYDTSVYAVVPCPDKIAKSKIFLTPEWNTYGYGLYGSSNYVSNRLTSYSTGVRGAVKKYVGSANAVADLAEDCMMSEMKCEASEEAADAAFYVADAQAGSDEGLYVGGGAAQKSEEPLRNVDVPLAFFKPSLVTDRQGVATVDFTTPDFVGTWQFQILGYTPDMRGNVLTLDAVASKRVMAQLNAPRFLRSGDRVYVAATLYNNSDSTASVAGCIELIEPLTGRVLLSQQFDGEAVDASGSRVVTVSYDVPSALDAITIRVYATVPGFSDGEQTVIPVFPSSMPIVESTPFYIKPDAGEFSVKLPKFDKDSKVTLTYCDNPVWECVTALPSMLRPESISILSQVNALFGNAVAYGLMNRYPELLEGIREMADPRNAADSTLVSPLQKNRQLKTVMLNNTPWVNDAQSETIRMQSLVEYADKAKAEEVINSVMKTLTDRQNSDGGWSWCPEMKSSVFMTCNVLHTLAELANMGYLPEGGDKLAKRACGYLDRQFAEDWNRSERKYVPVNTLLNYLYDKSAFSGIGTANQFKPLDAVVMKNIRNDWREFGICDKATAAMLLERRGEQRISRTILESLQQFASVSPEKGMWFDNLGSRGREDNALLTTARVLEAYAVIEPQNPAIDRLRQWMVITKQTQNWGDNRRTAEAINALLVSGSEWTMPTADPVIMLDGNRVDTGVVGAVKGTFTLNLDPSAASRATLSVSRSGSGPAWGGVVAQYVAPVLDVKSASVPQLSIEKNVYTVTPEESGATARRGDMAVGDLVRVTLTIICDRDIEYVAVTDSRAACLEPVVQLSGYTHSDGVWYYREVRDASTNLFIPFLAKGTHVISYDCTADRAGKYSLGVVAAQSQYAPEITAHSAGTQLSVR